MSESDDPVYHLRCHLNQEGPPEMWGALDRDELRRILLRLTWQPIATAPRDGTKMLLWWPAWDGEPVIGLYATEMWVSDDWEFDEDKNAKMAPPTYWMPLPEPPAGG